ncbi:MAG: glycosyltransferase family 39 protein [Acidobacteriota bacterium]
MRSLVHRFLRHVRSARYWYCLYAFSLAVRLAVLLPELEAPPHYPDDDGGGYYAQAAQFARTAGAFWDDRWHSYGGWSRGPLYFAFLGGWMMLAGPSVAAIRILQAVMGSVLPLLLAAFTGLLFGKTAGRIAGFLAVFLADLYFLPVQIMTENLYVFLILLALLLLAWASARDLSIISTVAGVTMGLAALVRSAPQYAVPVLALWLLYPFRRRRLWLAAAFAIGFLGAVVPWVVRNSLLYHRFFGVDNIGAYGVLWPNPEWERYVRDQLPPEQREVSLPYLDIRRARVDFPLGKILKERFQGLAANPSNVFSWFYLSFRHHNLKAIWWPPVGPPEASIVRWAMSVVGDIVYVFLLFAAAIGVGCVRRWEQSLPIVWILANLVPAGFVMWIARRYAIPYAVMVVPLAAAALASRRNGLPTIHGKAIACVCLAWMMAMDLPLLAREYSTLPALRIPLVWWRAEENDLSVMDQYAIESGAALVLHNGRGVLEVSRMPGDRATMTWSRAEEGVNRVSKEAPGGYGRVVFGLDPVPLIVSELTFEARSENPQTVRVTLNGSPLPPLSIGPDWRPRTVRVPRRTWRSANLLVLHAADADGRVHPFRLSSIRLTTRNVRGSESPHPESDEMEHEGMTR